MWANGLHTNGTKSISEMRRQFATLCHKSSVGGGAYSAFFISNISKSLGILPSITKRTKVHTL